MFELKRRTVAEKRVAAVDVVKAFDVIEEHEAGDGACARELLAEAFGFEGGKEAFHCASVCSV